MCRRTATPTPGGALHLDRGCREVLHWRRADPVASDTCARRTRGGPTHVASSTATTIGRRSSDVIGWVSSIGASRSGTAASPVRRRACLQSKAVRVRGRAAALMSGGEIEVVDRGCTRVAVAVDRAERGHVVRLCALCLAMAFVQVVEPVPLVLCVTGSCSAEGRACRDPARLSQGLAVKAEPVGLLKPG